MRALRTMELGSSCLHYGINLQTKVFSLLASLGKYAFKIQNPYQFIDCSKANGIEVACSDAGEVEGKDIRFYNSSHLSKQVSNSTGWAGKVFIWYGRCL